MAVNLVSLVTQFLTPDVIARIASTLGLESTTVQKAISGSIPAILAGLAGVAVKPEGAQQLSGAVASVHGWPDRAVAKAISGQNRGLVGVVG